MATIPLFATDTFTSGIPTRPHAEAQGPDASPRKFSHKSKAEDTEEDSQQEDDDKDEHIDDSNNAGDTRIQLNRMSILQFCADYEAASRTVSANKR